MPLKLDQVVPWGRSQAEYCRMFALTTEDLQRKILDCGGGPASFNAECHQQGYSVISCDPLYQFSVDEIEQRVRETYPIIVEGVRTNQEDYVWDVVRSPEALGEVRLEAMKIFLKDFPVGIQRQRYVVGELPQLPFADQQFDLALCSHLLFTYSEPLGLPFHLKAVQELCRVATEVRIFPILSIDGQTSPWLQPIQENLFQQGYQLTVQTVPYEFQTGGNQALMIRHPHLTNPVES